MNDALDSHQPVAYMIKKTFKGNLNHFLNEGAAMDIHNRKIIEDLEKSHLSLEVRKFPEKLDEILADDFLGNREFR